MNHFIKSHIPWIAWGLMIIVLISIPGNDLPDFWESVDRFQPDKLVHVLLFMVFVFLLLRGFDHSYSEHDASENHDFFSLFAGIILGGGTEVFQHFCIPGRNATLKDFLFNSLGCVIGWLVFSFWRNRVHHRFHK